MDMSTTNCAISLLAYIPMASVYEDHSPFVDLKETYVYCILEGRAKGHREHLESSTLASIFSLAQVILFPTKYSI